MNISTIEPPYLLAVTGTDEEVHECVARSLVADSGGVVRFLDGKKMCDWPSTYKELAIQLKFPAYFGENISALSECLEDLEWLPANAYVLVIDNARSVLKYEKDIDIIVFFKLFDRICHEWAIGTLPGASWERKPTPFHVVLHDKPSRLDKLVELLRSEIRDVPTIMVR